MVRRIAWISSQERDRSIDSSGQTRLYVSRIQHHLHARTKLGERKIHEKALR